MVALWWEWKLCCAVELVVVVVVFIVAYVTYPSSSSHFASVPRILFSTLPCSVMWIPFPPPYIIPLPDARCGMREEGGKAGEGGREEAALCISVTAPAASCSRHVRTPAV